MKVKNCAAIQITRIAVCGCSQGIAFQRSCRRGLRLFAFGFPNATRQSIRLTGLSSP